MCVYALWRGSPGSAEGGRLMFAPIPPSDVREDFDDAAVYRFCGLEVLVSSHLPAGRIFLLSRPLASAPRVVRWSQHCDPSEWPSLSLRREVDGIRESLVEVLPA